MKYTSYTYNCVRAEVSAFIIEDGVTEYHIMLHVTNPMLSYYEQMEAVFKIYTSLLQNELHGASSIFKRFFLSDAANQTDLLLARMIEDSDCALSVVQQPPLDGTKIALWAHLLTNVKTNMLPNGLFEVKCGKYRQLWLGGCSNKAANSEYQMRLLLNDYVMQLMEENCTLEANCLRTWIFVQNVDCNYAGAVKARNEVFATQNLTENTHYIASTGIEGRHADPKVLVMLDAYAIEGIKPDQIKYLYARTHLNPTYEYGVSFERGTAVDFEDRRQIIISGTASINNHGEIVFPGDVVRQAERMCENVETLLKEADSCFEELQYIIVYLRDTADYLIIKSFFEKKFPNIPTIITLASVCRPGWLVEMECMAVKAL